MSTVKVTLVELRLFALSFAQRINVDCWSSKAENEVLAVNVVLMLLYSYQVSFRFVSELV